MIQGEVLSLEIQYVAIRREHYINDPVPVKAEEMPAFFSQFN